MKYKIVKKLSKYTGNELFCVYRRIFRFFWIPINYGFSLGEAERIMMRDKEKQNWRKKKPELIGYYE